MENKAKLLNFIYLHLLSVLVERESWDGVLGEGSVTLS